MRLLSEFCFWEERTTTILAHGPNDCVPGPTNSSTASPLLSHEIGQSPQNPDGEVVKDTEHKQEEVLEVMPETTVYSWTP